MLVFPAEEKEKRITVLAATHTIKGNNGVLAKQPPVEFPYLSIYEGKEGNPMAGYTEYIPKLDNFYKRQAQYYLERPEKRTPVVPGFPDLDGGIHGHSGSYHKNGIRTDSRDRLDQGRVIQYTDGHGLTYGLFLDEARTMLLRYDTAAARPVDLLRNGVVDYDDYRLSTARAAKTIGEPILTFDDAGWGKQTLHYKGHYRYRHEAIFHYTIETAPVLEQFRFSDGLLAQHLHLPEGSPGLSYQLPALEDATPSQAGDWSFIQGKLDTNVCLIGILGADVDAEGLVSIGENEGALALSIAYWTGPASQLEAAKAKMLASEKTLVKTASSIPKHTHGSPELLWSREFKGKGHVSPDAKPYVIDTLPVPIRNPYQSTMLLSGIAFNPAGAAFVSTLYGDIWKVTGLDDDLKEVVWRRVFAGINSPFGLTWHNGLLYVGDKAELIALHDLNDDGEFDYVERKNQAYRALHRNVHAGAPMDSRGAFYYITAHGVKRLHNDKVEQLSPPLRTAMAIGVTHDDRVWSAGQEGDWTPASGIHEWHPGDDYYRPDGRIHKTLADIRPVLDPALVYIPRGIDNSTGGFATLRSDRFGLLGDKMLNLSYGACSAQLVLRDKPPGAARAQGAIVPLEGNYLAGLREGAVNPVDGQLYLVGHDGWGTYSVSDGCLQRLRYTGQPVFLPVGFRTHQNGIRIDFEEALDRSSVEAVENLFCQQWNYIYSRAYGSPEYSVKSRGEQGHDLLNITRSHLLADGKSLFVEIADLDPAMTIHLFGKLKGTNGQDFELNCFMTALTLAEPFTDFPEAEAAPPSATAERTTLELPIKVYAPRNNGQKITQEIRDTATRIEVGANDELRFILDGENQKRLDRIRVGTPVLFTLRNTGTADGMQHNALVVDKADTQAIGEFSDKTAGLEEARDAGYIPFFDRDMSKKLRAYSNLIGPGEKDEFLYVPKTAGAKTLVCTFPGHWHLMRIDFEVREAKNEDDKGAFFDDLEKRKDISFLRGKPEQPYVHFFAAEAEYGAFYSMPMLARLLNAHYGFNVSVSYSLDADGNIDSRVRDGLRGFDLLEQADLAVFFTRSKHLTRDTAAQLQAYLDNGKPIVGFRTANHGFNFPKESPDADHLRAEGWTHKGPKLCDMWKHKFGGHHGGSHADGFLTRIHLKEEGTSTHPILRGFEPYKDPRHLYILLKEPGKQAYDFTPLVHGEALKIFPHKADLPKVQPTVVVSEKARRMVYSSTCGADTFKHPSARRLALNSIFWALGKEAEIPEAGLNVTLQHPYDIPHDTHLRGPDTRRNKPADPHRGKPEDVFSKWLRQEGRKGEKRCLPVPYKVS